MKKHEKYKGFVVTKSVSVQELHCHLTEFEHVATGARCMHIANDDPENFFCLSFQTLPESSNGICHILEHTVLCGSEKFPVKDPFFAMNRRSLNTFMNALTGADFTCYPAASQVEQDFYNLLDVYYDSVFHPKLSLLSFCQEGCRLEFATSDDPTTPLEYKGVVFNEMKGSLASPMTRLIEAVNEALYPNTPYGFNSGGDPRFIPNLSYEELITFHQNFYHPSRCLFFFSGNLPIERHLDFLDERLKGVKKLPELPPIPKQPRFSHPIRKEFTYPYAADESTEDKSLIAFAWLTCPILDQIHLLALSVLDIILMDTDASPLKIALLKSGLCKQAQSMLDPEVSEIPYAIIINGCKGQDADALEELIFNQLKKICQEGVPQRLIDSALHQLEFSRCEITGDSAPFGLSLFYRSALLRQHGGNAEDGLRIHSLFEELRERFTETPHFLSDCISRYLLSNTHFVRITLNPSSTLATHELKQEKEKLEMIKKSLSEEQTKSIIERAQALVALQEDEEEEKIDLLPKISLANVPKKCRELSLTHSQAGSLELFSHHTFTNNITYADLVFPVPDIAEEDLWLLRLFTLLLPQLGSGSRSYEESLEYIQEHTGGVAAFLNLYHQVNDASSFVPTFHVRGKALYHKAPKLFSLFFDMVTNPILSDRKRLKELILKHATNLQSSFPNNALKYASNLSASAVTKAGKVNYCWYGLEYFYKIKKLARSLETELDSLISQLEGMQKKLLCLRNPHLVLTCDQTELNRYIEDGFEGLQDLPQQTFSAWQGNFSVNKIASQGRIIASPVSFTSAVFKNISYTHPEAPAVSLAANLFDSITLHKRVREQGGAYGAGSNASPLSGLFSFYSYRDPNIASTLDAFQEAINSIMNGNFDEKNLEEAKLEMIQAFDTPIAPGSRGEVAYGWWREGKSAEMRQAFRDAIMQATKEQIVQAVSSHIAPSFKEATLVSFASKDLLEKENHLLKEKGLPTLQIEKV